MRWSLWAVCGRTLAVALIGCMGLTGSARHSTSGTTVRPAIAPAQAAVVPTDLRPFIAPINPLPGQTLLVGPHAYIAASIMANAPIKRVDLRLDNAVLHPEVVGRDDSEESLFYQPRHWRPGPHVVRVTVWDVAGLVGQHTWSFRITPAAPAR